MVNLYARSIKGYRAYSKRPLKRGKNISIIGAMTFMDGFLTGLSFDGGTNGDTFLWFLEEILVPKLWSGAVVIMDNLPAHKVHGDRGDLQSRSYASLSFFLFTRL